MKETKIKNKVKVLLLNLPGKQSYLRDYYCNNISKSKYLHYPIDLLYLTGTLSENNFEGKTNGMLPSLKTMIASYFLVAANLSKKFIFGEKMFFTIVIFSITANLEAGGKSQIL